MSGFITKHTFYRYLSAGEVGDLSPAGSSFGIMTAPQLWALKFTLVHDTAQDRQRSLAGKFPSHVHMHKQCRFRGLGQRGETRKRSPIKAHRSRDVWLAVCCLVWQ